MNRNKFAIVLAALIVPGGLVALFGAWLLNRASRTERGRKALEAARSHVPSWLTSPLLPMRRAA